MEIKHPELKKSEVKVRKAKIDSDGNLFYVFEEHKIPSVILQENDEKSTDTSNKSDS